MSKIIKYFIDNARYKAEDTEGNTIWLEINYWENSFKISAKNNQLEEFAIKLLKKKHRVNLVRKMVK